MTTSPIDCVIVGYNASGFADRLAGAKIAAHVAGDYVNYKLNAPYFRGERRTYTDILATFLGELRGHPVDLHPAVQPNLATHVLQSYLRRQGLATERVNFFNAEKDQFAALLRDEPRAVAITTTFYTSSDPVTELVAFVRERAPETIIIVGGPHIFDIHTGTDLNTQDALYRRMGADIYVTDALGEASLAKVLFALRSGGLESLGGIPNLAIVSAERIRRTLRAHEDHHIDEARVEWSLVPAAELGPTAFLRTCRGCTFKCAFCSYPVFAGGHVVSSLQTVERELEALAAAGVRSPLFIDDTFNVPLGRFKELCRMMIRRKFDFRWYSYFRCSNADEEAYDLAAASGCAGTFLGIESGDQSVLMAMNKGASVAKYEAGIAALKARGILTYVTLIVGFPGETAETVKNTTEFVQRTAPDFYRASLWWNSPQAPIRAETERYGIQGADFRWRHNTMTWREAAAAIEEMYRTVDRSLVWPLYDADFWSMPFLLANGLTMDQIKAFARVAQEILVGGLDDVPREWPEHEGRIRAILAG